MLICLGDPIPFFKIYIGHLIMVRIPSEPCPPALPSLPRQADKKSVFHWKNTFAHGIFLYLAPKANDYDSFADLGFSRFSSKLTAFQTHHFLMQSFM